MSLHFTHPIRDSGFNPQSTPCCGISPQLPMLRGLRATLASRPF
jgi:hypothetical protein